MSWQGFILLSVFLYSVSVLLQRVLMHDENSDPVAYGIVFQFLTGMVLSAVGVLSGGLRIPELQPILGYFIIAILFAAFGNIFIFKALKQTEASRFSILFSTRVVWTVLTSTLFFAETLSVRHVAGMVFIAIGIVVVHRNAAYARISKHEVYALAAAAAFGLANALDRVMLKYVEVLPYTTLAFLLPPAVILILNPGSMRAMGVFAKPKLFVRMLILCVVFGFSALTFFYALQSAPNSSQVVMINSTNVIVIVGLGAVFLKERSQLIQKVLGAISACIGLVLVSV